MEISKKIEKIVSSVVDDIEQQVVSRGYRVSNELTNSVKKVLSGQRSSKKSRHIKGGGSYKPSVAGEPPAVRTGAFRASFKRRTNISKTTGSIEVCAMTESNLKVGRYVLGEILENGTMKMAPRPFVERTLKEAVPRVEKIFNEPYF